MYILQFVVFILISACCAENYHQWQLVTALSDASLQIIYLDCMISE
jgi:hypothetical protein